MNFEEGKGLGKNQHGIIELPKIHTQRNRLDLGFKYRSTLKNTLSWLDMDERLICSSEHSSPCLPIESFEHNGMTYPNLKIFVDVIKVLAVEPKGRELVLKKNEEKAEENESQEEGLKGKGGRGRE
ncbi:hypothetical protein JCGZ_10827 [Jatropha curcas]|uniref:G-patch domain-containing protein n=1 Tax=Jatropha curcas TaxID=180498 RepID=A0A067KUA8_JATCU|nr:hypothetical protein JCGZ_10827 [Jatropha curcas]